MSNVIAASDKKYQQHINAFPKVHTKISCWWGEEGRGGEGRGGEGGGEGREGGEGRGGRGGEGRGGEGRGGEVVAGMLPKLCTPQI